MSDLTTLLAQVEAIPDATADEWAKATRLLEACAPDLLAAIGVGT